MTEHHDAGAWRVLRGIRRRVVGLFRALPLWFQLVLAGLAVGVLFGLPAARDFHETRGLPVEHARVVEVEEKGAFFDGCGKSETGATITWQSADPPPGKPARFTDPDSCDGDLFVGEEVRLVRAPGEVFVDPPTAWSQVAVMTGAGVGLGVVIRLGVYGFEVLARRLKQRRAGDGDAAVTA